MRGGEGLLEVGAQVVDVCVANPDRDEMSDMVTLLPELIRKVREGEFAATLLALTLAVGVVIDDAIVVLENIHRTMEDKGWSGRRESVR